MGENRTSYDHAYEYLEYPKGPFAVAITQSSPPGKLKVEYIRDDTVLLCMYLNRSGAMQLAGLLLEEVKYLDHREQTARRRG